MNDDTEASGRRFDCLHDEVDGHVNSARLWYCLRKQGRFNGKGAAKGSMEL